MDLFILLLFAPPPSPLVTSSYRGAIHAFQLHFLRSIDLSENEVQFVCCSRALRNVSACAQLNMEEKRETLR